MNYSDQIQKVINTLRNINYPAGLTASIGIPLYNSIVELDRIVNEMSQEVSVAAEPTEQ